MAGFSAIPVVNQLTRPVGDNKDYDIWYKAGRHVLESESIYSTREQTGRRVLEFMYPPAAAVFLAPLTALGKIPFILSLDVLNSLSWMASLFLAVRLAENVTGRGFRLPIVDRPAVWSAAAGPSVQVRALVFPAVCTAAYVYDAYLLGQPNLLLLACLLAAFVALQRKKNWTAGALVAFAATCKAFPVLVVGYFVYRRHWRAAFASLVFLAVFLLVLPAVIRGVDRTARELRTWSGAMLMRYDTNGIAQRPGVTYEWKNASLLAFTHRLLRHVPAELPDKGPPVYVNVADLDFRAVSGVAIGLAGLVGLACVLVSPAHHLRTRATDAIEFAMLLVLITMLSPISWFYYGVWLLYPFAVVGQFIRGLPRGSTTKMLALASLAVCLLALNAVFRWLGPLRDVGMPCLGYIVLLAELAWILRVTLAAPRLRVAAASNDE